MSVTRSVGAGARPTSGRQRDPRQLAHHRRYAQQVARDHRV